MQLTRTKVDYFDPSVGIVKLKRSIQHDVLKLEVEVEQAERVHIHDSSQHLANQEATDTLVEWLDHDVRKEIRSSNVLKDETS